MEEPTTEIIFKKTKDKYKEIVAIMPYEIADFDFNFTCYSLEEGHNPCSYNYCLSNLRPAKETEYQNLYNELKSMGYNIKVIKRINYNKYLKAIEELYKNKR